MLKYNKFDKGETVMAAIIERSNAKHPGMIYLRSTGDGPNLLTNVDIINIFNEVANFLDMRQNFLTEITSGAASVDEFNHISHLRSRFDKIADTIVRNRGEKKGIWFPDPIYFNTILANINRLPEAEKMKRKRELYKDFTKNWFETLERTDKGLTLEQVMSQSFNKQTPSLSQQIQSSNVYGSNAPSTRYTGTMKVDTGTTQVDNYDDLPDFLKNFKEK